MLLRADDIVHDDDAPVKAQIVRKAFRGSEFLYTLRLASGETVMAHVPSHHDHKVGEWIGIRAVPIMLSNVSTPLLGAVDTAVVGQIPTRPTSARWQSARLSSASCSGPSVSCAWAPLA